MQNKIRVMTDSHLHSVVAIDIPAEKNVCFGSFRSASFETFCPETEYVRNLGG